MRLPRARLDLVALAATLLASVTAPAARAQGVAEAAETAVTAREPRPPATETAGPAVEFRFKKRPSIRIGEVGT